jgi:hypothetical protein
MEKINENELVYSTDKNMMEKINSEKKENLVFQIGRESQLDFEEYATVKGEEAAINAYGEMIKKVSSPSEIVILQEGVGDEDGKLIDRRDLQKMAIPKIDKKLEDITVDDKIDMNTASALGFSLFKGTNLYDYYGNPMSLDQMAEMVADSEEYAASCNGRYEQELSGSWSNPDSELAKQYYIRKKQYEEVLSAKKNDS